ncbi:MAG: VWA domain-containing protein [Ardenticatenaceae bacterium]|nr:VWA domain-containing protein [Ardenticatenaceae bacterium]MCB8986170.1 VWA domain-containing protein [Ardenticatenaceae bacterium]
MKRAFQIAAIFLILIFMAAGLVRAQEPAELVINYPQVTETPDAASLALDVFFTVVDGERRPLADPAIDFASIQIVGDSTIYDAAVSKPDTPFFVAIVLDASGSMGGAIDDMRQAASQAIDGAPPEAQFAVIRFNEDIDLVRDFTADQARVQDAINSVQVDNKGTCLYDATYTAVDLVNQATSTLPQARRAVIVFTDGRDELVAGEGNPCSRHTYSELVDFATMRNANVPIHTIGLSGGQNVNETELRNLARETGGLAAIGNQAALADSFRQIIEGLRSQFLASAQLFPTQGDHSATLTVNLRDGGSLTENFTFTAGRDYFRPPEPVELALDSLRPDEAGNLVLTLEVTSPEQVGQVEVNVLEDGVLVSRYTSTDIAPLLPIDLDTADLEPGRQYAIEVTADGPDGTAVKNADGETILLEHSFRYDPNVEVVPVAIRIEPVRVDEARGLLLVGVKAQNGQAIQSYEVSLVNEQTSIEEFHAADLQLDANGMLTVPLETIGQGSYTILLTANDGSGTAVADAEYNDVTYTPPPPPAPPGLAARLSQALAQFWYITLLIVLIVLGVIGWLMFRSRQEKLVTGTPVLQGRGVKSAGQQEALHNTMLFDQMSPAEKEQVAATGSKRLSAPRLRIVQTIDQSLQNKEVALAHFPFTVGREGCDLNIVGDGRVSRRHASINFENGRYYLIDLKSSNGTFVNGQRLPPDSPLPLSGPARIELGKFTTLELVF